MQQSVLIVDDEERFRKLIAYYLEAAGFCTFEAGDGLDALEIIRSRKIDLVILDLMMPRMDGGAFCRAVREFSDVFIVIFSAKSDDESRLELYGLGADDYITKPFNCKVLTAKAKAILSRLPKAESGYKADASGIAVDRLAHVVSVDGQEVYFTPKEYDLLLYLMDNAGIVLSRDAIISHIWGDDAGYDRMVDMHVSRIRDKLGGCASAITTVKAKGYKFEKRP